MRGMTADDQPARHLAPSTIRFCPLCRGDLVRIPLPPDQKEEAVCSACGFVFYLNPKLVAGTIPVEDGRVLLGRRNIYGEAGNPLYHGLAKRIVDGELEKARPYGFRHRRALFV
jgi:hypothetical protein